MYILYFCHKARIMGFSALGAVWVLDHYTYQSRSSIAHTELVYMLAEENGGLGHSFLGRFFYLLDISIKMGPCEIQRCPKAPLLTPSLCTRFYLLWG